MLSSRRFVQLAIPFWIPALICPLVFSSSVIDVFVAGTLTTALSFVWTIHVHGYRCPVLNPGKHVSGLCTLRFPNLFYSFVGLVFLNTEVSPVTEVELTLGMP